MANVKISELPKETIISNTDVFPFNKGTTTSSVTFDSFKNNLSGSYIPKPSSPANGSVLTYSSSTDSWVASTASVNSSGAYSYKKDLTRKRYVPNVDLSIGGQTLMQINANSQPLYDNTNFFKLPLTSNITTNKDNSKIKLNFTVNIGSRMARQVFFRILREKLVGSSYTFDTYLGDEFVDGKRTSSITFLIADNSTKPFSFVYLDEENTSLKNTTYRYTLLFLYVGSVSTNTADAIIYNDDDINNTDVRTSFSAPSIIEIIEL